MAVLQGKVEWAKVHKPDTKFKPRYEITVVLSKQEAANFKKAGVPLTQGDDGAWRLKLIRNAEDKDGKPVSPPIVVDRENNPFPDPIGNDSVCAIQYYVRDWTYKGKTGKSPVLMAVKVLELVPYKSKDTLEFESIGTMEEDDINLDELNEEDPFNEDD